MKNLLIFIVIVGVGGYFGSKWYLHGKVSDGMDMAVLMASPYAVVEYDGVASTLSGELTIEGIRVQFNDFRDELYIDSLGIDTPSFLSLLELGDVVTMRGGGLPDKFGFLIRGLRVPTDADYYLTMSAAALEAQGITDAEEPAAKCTGKYGFTPSALADLGYDEQVISMSMTFENQRGNYAVVMNGSTEDMWDVEADLVLEGDMLTEVSKGTAYRPKLKSMELFVTDRSINERVNKYCSSLGLSAEETVTAQMDAFKYMGADSGIEFNEQILEAYREHISGKPTFVVTAKPYQPVALSQIDLYKPSDVPALLNLAASAR